jgi:transketolase
VIVCKTVKGKGVSYMEDVMEWHASPVTKEQRDKAIAELKRTLVKLRKSKSAP